MHPAFLRAWHLRKLKPLRLVTSLGATDIRFSPLGKSTSEMLRVVEPE